MPKTIEERIKEIKRLCDMGIAVQDDVRFLLSELKRCREGLTDIDGLHHNCGQCNCAITSGEDQCQTWQIARQALHPEGVK